LRHVNPLSAPLFILCRAFNFTGRSLNASTLIPPAIASPALLSDNAVVAFSCANAIRISGGVGNYRQFFNQETYTKGAATPPALLSNCLASNMTNYGKMLFLISPNEVPVKFFDPRDNLFFFTVFFATF
jgi:hypothetical protein